MRWRWPIRDKKAKTRVFIGSGALPPEASWASRALNKALTCGTDDINTQKVT